MNSRLLSFALTIAITLFIAAPSSAAGGKKRDRGGAGRMLNRFDRNHDQKIDGQEAERLRRVFSALTALDADHDGKLSDSEIAAAIVEPGRRAMKSKTQ